MSDKSKWATERMSLLRLITHVLKSYGTPHSHWRQTDYIAYSRLGRSLEYCIPKVDMITEGAAAAHAALLLSLFLPA